MKKTETFLLFLSLAAFSCMLSGALAYGDEVYSKNEAANKLYKKGYYKEALKGYDDALAAAPADGKLKMNKGSALFQLGNFNKAEESYNGALSLHDKKALADAYYNLGNTQFMEGEQMLQTGNNGAQEKYQSALENYQKTLSLQPGDKDAKWNLQLAYARVKQMKNNPDKQDKKNNQDKKNQNQDKNQQDKNKNQDKNQQNKNQDQNKNQQDKNQQNQNQNQQNKQDQNNQNQPDQNNPQDQQQPPPQNLGQKSPEQQKQDMKKEEAVRLIEQYSDDADSLNKPSRPAGAVRPRQPEKDW